MSHLFSPIQIGNLSLSNRIVVPPMCQYSANNGQANMWHTIHWGGLAQGGAGMIIIEATAVTPTGRISPKCLGLWDEVTETSLATHLHAAKSACQNNNQWVIQLAHAGRKASTPCPWEGNTPLSIQEGGWITEAPSPISFFPDNPNIPMELTQQQLIKITEAFAEAAKRAQKIGFDGIEIHAAHGYLLHQFLSPLSNHRTDNYGGSLENRMRFPMEVVAAIRAAVGKDFPIGIRISATDWVETQPSWDVEQSIKFINALKPYSLAWVDVSSGALSIQQKITIGVGYQVPFAEAIRKQTGVTTMAVGMITEAQHAETILENKQADLIGVARAMLANPRWAWQAAIDLGEKPPIQNQYIRGLPIK